MEKRIIAVLCVLVLMVTALVACGKKVTVTGKNGKEYVAVTDDEGSTILDDNGKIVVYVTDEDGKYVKNSDGERETNAIDFPDAIVHKESVETAQFILLIPEGWTADSRGVLKKTSEDSETNITLDCKYIGDLKEGETLETYLENDRAVRAALTENFQANGAEMTNTETASVVLGYAASVIDVTIQAPESRMLTSKMIYFATNSGVYKILYSGNDRAQDEGFDLVAFVEQNLTVK